MPPAWRRFATCSFALLATYLLLVSLLGETVAGARIGLAPLAVIAVSCLALAYWLTGRLARWPAISNGLLMNLAVASATLLIALLAGDILYTVARNAKPAHRQDATRLRYGDSEMWCRRLFPPFYWPTSGNFRLYKANVRIEGSCQGDLFDPLLTERFPTVAARVAERRHIVHSIDEHGFRETTPLAEAEVFALGDSFVFGYGVSQQSSWVELLQDALGRPVYNLGITDSSPGQQLMLLRYLLATKADTLRISRLLWMVFEGNDLEDSYARSRPAIAHYGEVATGAARGTVLEDLRSLAYTLRSQSMIRALLDGQLTASRSGRVASSRAIEHQGLLLRRPLYRSEAFGQRFFEPRYITRAGKPASYVQGHPNRPLLDQALADMASLGRQRGFDVTVIIVPSAARLYAPHFEDLTVSERPHFIEHVESQATDLGLEVVDLYRAMRPYATKELLFWRDDGHWNPRGNEVAAQIIAERCFAGAPS